MRLVPKELISNSLEKFIVDVCNKQGNTFNKLPRNLVQLEVEENTKYKPPHVDQNSLAGGVVCMRVSYGEGKERGMGPTLDG